MIRQTILFLAIIALAFSAIIDPVPGTLQDVSNSPLTSISLPIQLDPPLKRPLVTPISIT